MCHISLNNCTKYLLPAQKDRISYCRDAGCSLYGRVFRILLKNDSFSSIKQQLVLQIVHRHLSAPKCRPHKAREHMTSYVTFATSRVEKRLGRNYFWQLTWRTNPSREVTTTRSVRDFQWIPGYCRLQYNIEAFPDRFNMFGRKKDPKGRI